MEIWKDIQGYEGKYRISNTGRVISLPRKKWNGKTMLNILGKEKNICLGKIGYKCTRLWKNGKSQLVYIHRLLAIHFIPNPDNLPEVNHKNGNKGNTYLSNLEWISHAGNLAHAGEKGLMSHGEGRYNAKLTDMKVKEIRERFKKGGITLTQLAEDYGVNRANIRPIIDGKRWKHVT